MEVIFGDDELERCYREIKRGTLRWGKKIAEKYVERINRLNACETGHDLGTFPELKFHPLKGPRAGQWAMNLDPSWRLIVTFSNKRWTVVRVEEVSNHYGD